MAQNNVKDFCYQNTEKNHFHSKLYPDENYWNNRSCSPKASVNSIYNVLETKIVLKKVCPTERLTVKSLLQWLDTGEKIVILKEHQH